MHDLPSGHPDTDAVLASNAQRESAFLVKIKGITAPADGLAGLLDAADQSTVAVAAKVNGAGPDKSKGQDKPKDNNGKGQGANPKAQPKK
jgi:hypothetical protein